MMNYILLNKDGMNHFNRGGSFPGGPPLTTIPYLEK
ncbi:hypothetical protein CfE428DRAFT_5001 [Chthoniobacter flavus Ellin428]|uniref:Uncharacterized protein n=1 Tax=Chthoniobacter flavus Ellin428 TaxID=497964 RepID=B4D7W1_9BACT|nr:hypothetical protein CfE428DRAFT_5001 [Chthoniobacter flavus Ellin428]TCO92280.1 hypothetical protein EV701_10649 [Chthoniobacter flavus]